MSNKTPFFFQSCKHPTQRRTWQTEFERQIPFRWKSIPRLETFDLNEIFQHHAHGFSQFIFATKLICIDTNTKHQSYIDQ